MPPNTDSAPAGGSSQSTRISANEADNRQRQHWRGLQGYFADTVSNSFRMIIGGRNHRGRNRSRAYLDELTSLPLKHLDRRMLAPGAAFNATVKWNTGASIALSRHVDELRLSFERDGTPFEQALSLVYRERHFGGHLVCVLCPSKSLGRAEAAQFQCEKLRERIRSGTRDCGINYVPRRPKGMRRVTYQRLRRRTCDKLNRYHAELDKSAWWVKHANS
jgi:hypothetical protein